MKTMIVLCPVIQVSVANGTLEYDIHQVSGLNNTHYSQWSPIVYASVAVVFVLAVIAAFSIFALCFMKFRRKRQKKAYFEKASN